MALFGNMDGDFMGLGSILKESPELDLDEAYFVVVEDGKALMIYGHLSDDPINSRLEIKTKDANDKWVDYEGKLVRFELPIEVIEKEYNGKKNKKEPTPQSKFIAEALLPMAGEGKYYQLRLDLGASEEYLTCVQTGKTRKGTELSEELKGEFIDSIFMVKPIETVEHLANAKKAEKRSGGARYVSQGQQADERLAWLLTVASDETKLAQVEEVVALLDNHPAGLKMTSVLALILS